MEKHLAVLFMTLALCGCDDRREHAVAPYTPPPEGDYSIESKGVFNAGDRQREILIITDKATGHKYFGITGVGITDLYTESNTVMVGKVPVTTTTTHEE